MKSPKQKAKALRAQLHVAVSSANPTDVQRLLSLGVDVDKADTDLYTPLHRACELGNAEICSLLLHARADPDVSHAGLDGWTPLHMAAWKSHTECAEILIKHGASKDALDWYGLTPSHWFTKDASEAIKAIFAGDDGARHSSAPKNSSVAKDNFANLRQSSISRPSAVHLANIERCMRASDEHGTKQGEACADFDPKCKL
jgi:hypothetical protein